MSPAYCINDGYTEPGYIAEWERVHGPVRFTFRPMLHEERLVFLAQTGKGGLATSRAMCDAICRHVKSWDIPGANGETLAINADTVRTLKPAIVERLYCIVLGIEASAPDPNAKGKQITDQADAEYQALMQGAPVGEAKEASDQKN